MARTRQVVTEAELAPAFHRYLHGSATPPLDLIGRLRDEGALLRELAEAGRSAAGSQDARAMFIDRMSVLGCAEAIAVLLWFAAPERRQVPESDERAALAALESWVVRRVLTGLPITGPGAGWQRVLALLGDGSTGDLSARIAATCTDDEARYWPADADLRLVLPARPIALELPESTARVLLEALTDDAFGAGAVRHGDHPVVLREVQPTGDETMAPMLRHVLGNLTLADAPVVEPDGDVTARTAALVERVIRRWPGPPPPSLPGAAAPAPGWPGTAGR